MTRDADQSWADSLNPDVVRQRLMLVGLFMVAHEFLVGCIRDRPLYFFADRFKRSGDPIRSKKYEEEVLALDPKGKCDPMRGGSEWLRRMNVIDETDEIAIREVTEARNKLAHELGDALLGEGMPNLSELFPKLLSLIKKIEGWWILNVEVPANPDFDAKEVDEGSVTSGPEIAMNVLWDIAMGKEEEAWAYYRQWTNRRSLPGTGT